jgi:hypothetical protein
VKLIFCYSTNSSLVYFNSLKIRKFVSKNFSVLDICHLQFSEYRYHSEKLEHFIRLVKLFWCENFNYICKQLVINFDIKEKMYLKYLTWEIFLLICYQPMSRLNCMLLVVLPNFPKNFLWLQIRKWAWNLKRMNETILIIYKTNFYSV